MDAVVIVCIVVGDLIIFCCAGIRTRKLDSKMHPTQITSLSFEEEM